MIISEFTKRELQVLMHMVLYGNDAFSDNCYTEELTVLLQKIKKMIKLHEKIHYEELLDRLEKKYGEIPSLGEMIMGRKK